MIPLTTSRARAQRRRAATAAAAAALALALTACQGNSGGSAGGSGGSGDSSDPAEEQAKAQDAMLEYAQCMREQGVPMDDPKPGELGVVVNNVKQEVLDAAERKCGHLLEDVISEDSVSEIPAEEKEAMLAQAQCMRDRGWDVPDPQFGENGQVKMEFGNGIDPDDPSFHADQRACAEKSGIEAPSFEGP